MRVFLNSLNNNNNKSTISLNELIINPKLDIHRREIKQMHPWEFEYKRFHDNPIDILHPIHDFHHITNSNMNGLYWQQACLIPREDVEKVILDPKHIRGKKLYASNLLKEGYNDYDKMRLFKQFENVNKLFLVLRKVYKLIGNENNWKKLRNEFKKYMEISKNNNITNSIDVTTENFHKIMKEQNFIGLSKSDIYLISYAFRGMGMPEVVRIDEWYATMKIIDIDDKKNGYDWEADEKAKEQAEIDALASGYL